MPFNFAPQVQWQVGADNDRAAAARDQGAAQLGRRRGGGPDGDMVAAEGVAAADARIDAAGDSIAFGLGDRRAGRSQQKGRDQCLARGHAKIPWIPEV